MNRASVAFAKDIQITVGIMHDDTCAPDTPGCRRATATVLAWDGGSLLVEVEGRLMVISASGPWLVESVRMGDK